MYKAWTVKAAKQPMVLETANFGPLGAEDVEVAVDHGAPSDEQDQRGLCPT